MANIYIISMLQLYRLCLIGFGFKSNKSFFFFNLFFYPFSLLRSWLGL